VNEELTVIAPKRGALVSLLSSGEPLISFCNERRWYEAREELDASKNQSHGDEKI